MLEMKPECKTCNKELNPTTDSVFICSYECTYCQLCTEEHNFICPACKGNLCERPKRITR